MALTTSGGAVTPGCSSIFSGLLQLLNWTFVWVSQPTLVEASLCFGEEWNICDYYPWWPKRMGEGDPIWCCVISSISKKRRQASHVYFTPSWDNRKLLNQPPPLHVRVQIRLIVNVTAIRHTEELQCWVCSHTCRVMEGSACACRTGDLCSVYKSMLAGARLTETDEKGGEWTLASISAPKRERETGRSSSDALTFAGLILYITMEMCSRGIYRPRNTTDLPSDVFWLHGFGSC